MNYNSIIKEYQQIINLLENATNQPSKFRTKNCVKVNDESRGTYNVNNQIKFKNSMLRSSLCDYGDSCILVSATITCNMYTCESEIQQQQQQQETIEKI